MADAQFSEILWSNRSISHIKIHRFPHSASMIIIINSSKSIKMASGHITPLEVESTASQASVAVSRTSLPSAFGCMMNPQPVVDVAIRDRCQRPVPVYNERYDPSKPPPEDLPPTYSPYVFGEPLFDDRHIIIANLLPGFTAAGASKKPRTSWVWRLGYSMSKATSKGKVAFWVCKHCK